MAQLAALAQLADVFSPLNRAFGGRLSFSHEGSVAQWAFDGHLAIVELGDGDRIFARFVAPPDVDAVSGDACTAVYARGGSGYALTRAGCEHMVADMVAFFSGTREPIFTFVAAG